MELPSSDLVQLANDRAEIADALYRYAFGLDHGDADSLASALTEDCVLDFTPAAEKLRIKFPVMQGRESVVKTLIPLIGPLDTSHTASNLQIEVNGDSGTLHAYVMSQHFMPGEGCRQGTDHTLFMNRYDADLIRDGKTWRFSRIVIDNAWAQGDPAIITAMATLRVARSKSASKP
jgi:ketosteroid isomerase-like protein